MPGTVDVEYGRSVVGGPGVAFVGGVAGFGEFQTLVEGGAAHYDVGGGGGEGLVGDQVVAQVKGSGCSAQSQRPRRTAVEGGPFHLEGTRAEAA